MKQEFTYPQLLSVRNTYGGKGGPQTFTYLLKEADRQRIPCGRFDCKKPADVVEHVNWDTGNTAGISFFASCHTCHGLDCNGKPKVD